MLTFLGMPLGTLSQIGTFGILLALFAGCATVFIKGIPDRLRVRNESKKLEIDEATTLRAEVHTHMEELRAQLRDERLTHATEMRAFNLERDDMLDRISRLEQRNIRQQIRHNAERALARHQLANITQCFDAMLLLVDTNPEKAPEIVVKVKEMRATQILAEAEEKAAIRAAEIAADSGENDHDGN